MDLSRSTSAKTLVRGKVRRIELQPGLARYPCVEDRGSPSMLTVTSGLILLLQDDHAGTVAKRRRTQTRPTAADDDHVSLVVPRPRSLHRWDLSGLLRLVPSRIFACDVDRRLLLTSTHASSSKLAGHHDVHGCGALVSAVARPEGAHEHRSARVRRRGARCAGQVRLPLLQSR